MIFTSSLVGPNKSEEFRGTGLEKHALFANCEAKRGKSFRGGAMHGSSSQMIASSRNGKQIFNAVILRHATSEVLLAHDGCQFELPIVIIPAGTRIAEEVNHFTSRVWGLRTVCLFQPEASSCDSGDINPFLVLEARDSLWLPPAGFHWVSREGITKRRYSVKDAGPLQEVITTAASHEDSSLSGPFARAGWFDDLLSWAQQQLDPHRLQLTGQFCQLNADPSFSLVRLETNGPSIWFKAVGELNQREFPITVTLAKHFPGYLPTLIATEPAWNGWLTFEVDGVTLDENSGVSQWEKAAETLANLQIESIQHTQELLDVSCRDIRISALLDRIDSFFDLMAEMMAKQLKTSPPPLSVHELQLLGEQLKNSCSCLGELGLPDTLGHLDFNPGNVVIASDRCVFLDWAEAYVGHPFLTFEYLREHLSRIHSRDSVWLPRMTSRYLQPWDRFASAEDLSRALELTPLMAVFAYAVGNDVWCDPQRRENPRMTGYLRGLTRRMQREARLPKIRDGHA